MTTPADNIPFVIINDAMKDAGLLRQGQVPNGEQLAENMRRLRGMVNYWQTQGCKLFLALDVAVPLVSGQRTYSIYPSGDVDMTKPLRVDQAYYLTTDGVRRPIIVLSWNEWLLLSDTTTESSINNIFVNNLYNKLEVSCWPIPDSTAASNGALHILVRAQAQNPVSLTETMQFPPEWQMALHWCLSRDICTGQPDSVIQRCEMNAQRYEEALLNWDVENVPTRFTPDPQIQNWNYNRFS